MRGLFVTGTDTGVGKSVLSASLIAAMVAAGERVRAFKPVVTGLDEPHGPELDEPRDAGGEEGRRASTDAAERWPPDHELLASVAGMRPEDVSPLRFGPAVSPHLAAELAGERIDPAALLSHALADASPAGSPRHDEILIVEGVGGLLVPLARDYSVRDLAAALTMPLLIAARPGLGTINHTLLTLEAARTAGLHVSAVVLTPWPASPAPIERSNRYTIEQIGEVEVETLTHIASPAAESLSAAAGALPWRSWLERATGV